MVFKRMVKTNVDLPTVPPQQVTQPVQPMNLPKEQPRVQEQEEEGEVWELGQVATQTSPVFVNNETGEKIVDPNIVLVRILNILEELKGN